MINPALVLKRYQDLINRANLQKSEREADYKTIQLGLQKVIETSKSGTIREKKIEMTTTKIDEAVKLTHSGIVLLDSEIDSMQKRLEMALEHIPASLIKEANALKDE